MPPSVTTDILAMLAVILQSVDSTPPHSVLASPMVPVPTSFLRLTLLPIMVWEVSLHSSSFSFCSESDSCS